MHQEYASRVESLTAPRDIYTLRIFSGLCQEEFSARARISRQTLNSLETGRTQKLSYKILYSVRLMLQQIYLEGDHKKLRNQLLNTAILMLLDNMLPSGRPLSKDEIISISEVFYVAAKIYDAKLPKESFVGYCEILFPAKLPKSNNHWFENNTGGTAKELQTMYEESGLAQIFRQYRERKKQEYMDINKRLNNLAFMIISDVKPTED